MAATPTWVARVVGMGALVHQRGRIGPGAMVGMGAVVRGEVPPFTVTVGSPARIAGLNEVGLRRLGCADPDPHSPPSSPAAPNRPMWTSRTPWPAC